MSSRVFPEQEWKTLSPEAAGFHSEKLARAKQWLDEKMADQTYRVVIVRHGQLVVEWNQGADRNQYFRLASAAKSIYSNVLGIAIAEGALLSADAKVYDFYPEMMDVPEGEGPKPGRYAFEKDREITFRQLISNTSGYMKPGEEPGQVFHYQTYGMNILTHAIAKAYGYYDINDPEGSPGFKMLIEEKLAKPIGANWKYTLSNFDLQPKARLNIFGYYCQVGTTALDWARLGWLWCNWGRWRNDQIIPEAWLRESVKTEAAIVAHSPQTEWKYGLGFWVNDRGQLWSDLPRDGFTASGAGGHYLTVFPTQRLVVVQNPGRYHRDASGGTERGNPELLATILGALED